MQRTASADERNILDHGQEKHKIFVLKDSQSSTYGMPITIETRGRFIRDVQEELAKGQAIFARHPQDFSIFEIGEFDPRTGNIYLYETKNCLGLVQDFKQNH